MDVFTEDKKPNEKEQLAFYQGLHIGHSQAKEVHNKTFGGKVNKALEMKHTHPITAAGKLDSVKYKVENSLSKLILKSFDVSNIEEARNGELDPDDLSNNIQNNAFPFRARSNENKVTAPEMAYQAIFKKLPTNRLYATDYKEKKIWKNLIIDKYIDEDILDKIDNLPKVVSIRAVSQGHSKDRPTYIVIRTIFKDSKEIKNIINSLNNNNINIDNFYKFTYDEGNSNYYRVCITGSNVFYDIRPKKLNTIYNNWWNGLYPLLEKVFK